MIPDTDSHILRAWCMQELTYWRAADLDWTEVEQKFSQANIQHRSVFLLIIADGLVSIADKDRFYTREELDDPDTKNGTLGRINAYRIFIQEAIRLNDKNIRTIIAIDTQDIPINRYDIPIFGFQKKYKEPAILLPDIDFLLHSHYVHPQYSDIMPYDQKSLTASFVGSTTGGGLITAQSVADLLVPRIRRAVYFKNNPNVDFRVPNIGQCDSETTADLIRDLGVCGELTPFQTQLRSRFIISMDGNGATCSRVVRTLKSNSVLLKYDSPHHLYYFSQMIPWMHYIPISKDSDIEDVLKIESRNPGHFSYITQEANYFYERFLVYSNVLKYTSDLLAMYCEIFPEPPGLLEKIAHSHLLGITVYSQPAAIALNPLLHIQNVGDVGGINGPWFGFRGEGRAIEGFTLSPADNYLAQHLEYCALQRNVPPSEWCRAGEFCGSRGLNSPILGIRVRVGGPRSHLYECRYAALCIDGTTAGPCQNGELCASDTSAPLEALNISVISRREDEGPVRSL